MRGALSEALAGPKSALTFIRLVLACLVLTSHTWPVGGFGPDPHLGDLTLGSFALFGFFAISGYLLAGSRTRLPLSSFLLRRAARIYPGLWVALLVTAFVAAPLGALAGAGAFDLAAAADFVLRNATGRLIEPGIGSQLAGVPAAGKWNIPIWTLEYELLCYLLVAAIFSVPLLRRRPTLTSAVALGTATVANVWFATGAQPPGYERLSILSILFGFFAAGMLVWSLRATFRPHPQLVLLAAVLTAGAALTGATTVVSPFPLAVLVLFAAALSPVGRGIQRDLSFGVYVYAWPVQQLTFLIGVNRLGPWWSIAFALTFSILLAYCSWTVVERPAIDWARRRTSAKPATSTVLAAPPGPPGPAASAASAGPAGPAGLAGLAGAQPPARPRRSATWGDTAGSSPRPSAR